MTLIDLFAGAGGLSEGFLNAGYSPLVHIEMDKHACETLKTRVAYHYLKGSNGISTYKKYVSGLLSKEELYQALPDGLLNQVIQTEISSNTIDTLFKSIDEIKDSKSIDIIVGGPPCQAYSLVGRSRMGTEVAEKDKRYRLYHEYGLFLKRYQPKIFLFENVGGILSAEKGKLFLEIRSHFESLGYSIDKAVLNASNHGVFQNRKRVFILGVKTKAKIDFPSIETYDINTTLGETLFNDLPSINPSSTAHIYPYTQLIPNEYQTNFSIRTNEEFVTHHLARFINERDKEIYSLAIDMWIEKKERLKYNKLPESLKTHKNQSVFLDRFKVVDPYSVSHTVVAHLAKDGHYFIHPDKNQIRSISVREAARIQSFPDNFYFEGGKSASYRQIGNAVPPILANFIANSILSLI